MQASTIFQSLQQGILICDRGARIVYFNEAYGDFIGQPLAEVKGRRITDFRAHALAPSVIDSGEPVEGVIRREGNQTYYASVYPIVEGDAVRGSISVVTSLAQHRLKTEHTGLSLDARVREFEKREIEAEISWYGGGVAGKKKAARALGISLATLYNKIKE